MPIYDAGEHVSGVTVRVGGDVLREDTTALISRETRGGLKAWGGSLGVTPQEGFVLVNADDVEIELADGRRGKIVVTSADPTSTATNVRFQGTGPCPID